MTNDSNHPNVASKNTRRDARELALRILYQLEVGRQPVEEVLDAALEQSHLDEFHSGITIDLVKGTCEYRDAIDALLAAHSDDWEIDRLPIVDKNILRQSTYELQYRQDSPVAVVCNEAVELAKKYSTAESSKFVNGVLGSLARLPRGDADRQAGAAGLTDAERLTSVEGMTETDSTAE